MSRNTSKLILLSYIALAGGVVWLVQYIVEASHQSETGENVPSVAWLPDSASNVSYYRSHMNTAYEFDISESDFCSWSRWKVAEIEEPKTIKRYLAFFPLVEPGANSTDAELNEFLETGSRRVARLDEGLYYGHLQKNGGGVWVAFDRKSRRAYYCSAPR